MKAVNLNHEERASGDEAEQEGRFMKIPRGFKLILGHPPIDINNNFVPKAGGGRGSSNLILTVLVVYLVPF